MDDDNEVPVALGTDTLELTAPVIDASTRTSPTTLIFDCGVVVPTPTTPLGVIDIVVLSTVGVSLAVGAIANIIVPVPRSNNVFFQNVVKCAVAS